MSASPSAHADVTALAADGGPAADDAALIVPKAERVIPRPRPGRWLLTVGVALIVAMFLRSVFSNGNWHWGIVGEYLFAPSVLSGLGTTVLLTGFAEVLGAVLGAVVAGLRLSESRILSPIAGAYIWFFRGVPVIVQVIFFVYLAQLYPYLSLGIPFGPQFLYFNTNNLIAPIVGCIIGLCLNESAYQAEIIRGAVAAVPKGQHEAAAALGMTPPQIRRRVLLPQILPVALPPFFNNVISMTKTSAVVILASVTDLFSAVSAIAQQNFAQVPLLLDATVWYLVLTAVLTALQYGAEWLLTRKQRRR